MLFQAVSVTFIAAVFREKTDVKNACILGNYSIDNMGVCATHARCIELNYYCLEKMRQTPSRFADLNCTELAIVRLCCKALLPFGPGYFLLFQL